MKTLAILTALIGSTAADIWSTGLAIECGHQEGNPVVAAFIAGAGSVVIGMLVVKFVVFAVLLEYAAGRGIVSRTVTVITTLQLFVAYQNTAVIFNLI